MLASRKLPIAVLTCLLLCPGLAQSENSEEDDGGHFYASFLAGLGTPGVATDSPYEKVGTGIGGAVGYRVSELAFEWRFMESYNLALKSGLDSQLTRSQLSLQSAGLRYQVMDLQNLTMEALASVALASLPLLQGGKGESDTELGAEDLHGIGVGVGASLGYTAGDILLTLEARAYAVYWETPGGPYATSLERNGGALSGEASADTITALPMTLSLGVTFFL